MRSVEPVLRALQEAGVAKHVRHPVNDRDDLVRQLRRWSQAQHEAYRIGYIALHGSPATVHIGRYVVRLLDMAEQLEPAALKDKCLHFGSCSVLNLDDDKQQELRRALGVKVLTGFTKDVDWFESMAFELLLFEALARFVRPADAARHLERTYGELADRLGFVMVR